MELFKKQDRDETLVAFDKEAKRRKREKFWNEVIDNVKKVGNWCLEHPVETTGICMTVAGGAYKASRLITRNREIKHEQYIADCRFYDPRYGEYVFSKRKLTTGERNRLKDIYNSDRKMSYSQALTKMGLNKD